MTDFRTEAYLAIRDHIGETVWIAGDGYGFEAEVIRGQTSPEADTSDHPGWQAVSQTIDFLILSEDAPPGYIPATGDTITGAAGGRHTVAAQGDGRAWRWSGSGREVMRIHTKPEDER